MRSGPVTIGFGYPQELTPFLVGYPITKKKAGAAGIFAGVQATPGEGFHLLNGTSILLPCGANEFVTLMQRIITISGLVGMTPAQMVNVPRDDDDQVGNKKMMFLVKLEKLALLYLFS